MSDWYDVGKERLFKYLSETTGVDELHVRLLYSELVDIGFIDYDTEKEIIAEDFNGDCDE